MNQSEIEKKAKEYADERFSRHDDEYHDVKCAFQVGYTDAQSESDKQSVGFMNWVTDMDTPYIYEGGNWYHEKDLEGPSVTLLTTSELFQIYKNRDI